MMAASPVELSPFDYVTWVIGLTARKDVLLEGTFRELWRVLVSARGPVPQKQPRRLRGALDACRELLESSALPSHVINTGRQVIDAAEAAHNSRTEVVHGQWTPSEDGTWARGHTDREVQQHGRHWSVDQFDDVLRTLTRANERAFSMLWIVRCHFESLFDEIYEFDLAVAEDRFTIDDNGEMTVLK